MADVPHIIVFLQIDDGSVREHENYLHKKCKQCKTAHQPWNLEGTKLGNQTERFQNWKKQNRKSISTKQTFFFNWQTSHTSPSFWKLMMDLCVNMKIPAVPFVNALSAQKMQTMQNSAPATKSWGNTKVGQSNGKVLKMKNKRSDKIWWKVGEGFITSIIKMREIQSSRCCWIWIMRNS